MKRSEINTQIKNAISFIESQGFKLPPFTNWTPSDWIDKNHEYDEIRENMLGWDVTDYGQGHFESLGLVLVTIRNGNQKLAEKYPKPYAEKIFILQPGQISPMHFHYSKTEDIINRGGGNLMVQLYNKTADNKLDDSNVLIKQDGRAYYVSAGTMIRLTPGESISFEKGVFHEMTVEKGSSQILVGEISMCNDDNIDNYFFEPLARFPFIDEDEPPFRLLCTEYPTAINE